MRRLLRHIWTSPVASRFCAIPAIGTSPPSPLPSPSQPIGSHKTPDNEHKNDPDDKEDDDDDDAFLSRHMYRPPSEDAARHAATRRYLRALVTTECEQEWRDMLSAAIRHGTWKEHHLRAVLRAVRQAQYDSPASTEALRLRRAVGVVQTGADEGFRPKEETVQALLVMLMRSCVPRVGGGEKEEKEKEKGEEEEKGEEVVVVQPIASRRDVWQFLAWMELRGYHAMSTAVLEELEGLAEDDQRPARSAAGGPVGVSVRRNRLEFLRNEHRRLCAKGKSEKSGRVTPPAVAPEESCA